MSDERRRKRVKKGLKRRVLTGVKIEIGRPQAIKKGSEIKDTNSCSWMLLRRDRNHFFIVFTLLRVAKYIVFVQKLLIL